MKADMAKSIMLICPNLSKPFEVYTDPNDLAMGGRVTQNNGKNAIS